MVINVIVVAVMCIIIIAVIVLYISNLKTKAEIEKLNDQIENSSGILEELSDYNNILANFYNEQKSVDNNSGITYNVSNYTGNMIIDSTVSYKKNQAEQLGIRVDNKCSWDNDRARWPLGEADTIALLLNTFDNAIEAALKCEEPFITIDVKGSDKIEISFANSKLMTPVDTALPVTTKEDKRYHGYGTTVIKEIVNKYNGKVEFFDFGDTFRMKIKL